MVDESEALRACLERTGRLERDQFLAQVHRRRFAKVLRKHPLRAVELPAPMEVMQTSELLHTVTRFVGPPTAQQCSVVSRALRKALASAPPRLYALGGSDGVGALSVVERFDERCMHW